MYVCAARSSCYFLLDEKLRAVVMMRIPLLRGKLWVQAVLRSRGVRAYVCNAGDTKIVAGENWEDNIMRALQQCTTFVVLGTRNYGAGHFCVAQLTLLSRNVRCSAHAHEIDYRRVCLCIVCAAQEGTETVDTKGELRYALLPNNKKDIVVVKLTDSFNHPYAQARFCFICTNRAIVV
jgi:hypothetical protein